MTFWMTVGVVYLMLLGIGIALGHLIADRFRRGNGGQQPAPEPDLPPAPTFGVEWLPLGTAFDRQLLPGVFADGPLADVS